MVDEVASDRDGLTMTFRSLHRPLERYIAALATNDLVVEELREPPLPSALVTDDRSRERWQRIPNALHVRARRTSEIGR